MKVSDLIAVLEEMPADSNVVLAFGKEIILGEWANVKDAFRIVDLMSNGKDTLCLIGE